MNNKSILNEVVIEKPSVYNEFDYKLCWAGLVSREQHGIFDQNKLCVPIIAVYIHWFKEPDLIDERDYFSVLSASLRRNVDNNEKYIYFYNTTTEKFYTYTFYNNSGVFDLSKEVWNTNLGHLRRKLIPDYYSKTMRIL